MLLDSSLVSFFGFFLLGSLAPDSLKNVLVSDWAGSSLTRPAALQWRRRKGTWDS